MTYKSSSAPIACRFNRLCRGYTDPANSHHGQLCPDCFDKIDDGYEQVEQEEHTDRLADQAESLADGAAAY
ncbi:hypothetical protein [Pseudomonas zeae]|uniref:hypothetical protein n=1 Tax=Pseudomonas zeae TaxID=2745510 RepID=UPI0039E0B9A5